MYIYMYRKMTHLYYITGIKYLLITHTYCIYIYMQKYNDQNNIKRNQEAAIFIEEKSNICFKIFRFFLQKKKVKLIEKYF